MTGNRVAITGIGIVTALGVTREETWARMLEGACGIGPVSAFDVGGFRSQIAGEVAVATLKIGFCHWNGGAGRAPIALAWSPPTKQCVIQRSWRRPSIPGASA